MDFSSSKFMLPFAFDRLGKVWGIDYAAIMPSSDCYRGQIKFSVCLGLMIVLYSPFKWIFFHDFNVFLTVVFLRLDKRLHFYEKEHLHSSLILWFLPAYQTISYNWNQHNSAWKERKRNKERKAERKE